MTATHSPTAPFWRAVAVGPICAATLAIGVDALAAQPPQDESGPAPEQVAVDALRCWRDLERRAVTVGEPFTMTITCEVVETDTATTIPNEATLAPETIELLPFDVIEGRRFDDVRDGPYRFFQYQYTLRVIDEDAVGHDVELPALALSYHIERRVDGNTALPGRDVQYILPAESMRLLSLVPEGSSGLKDIRVASLGAADERRFRANLAVLGAGALGLTVIALLVVAVVRARQRHGAPERVRVIPNHAVVRHALAELVTLKREVGKREWTAPETGRALAALRLAAASALSVPVTHSPVHSPDTVRDGQLLVSEGRMRRRTTALSSAVTPQVVADALANPSVTSSVNRTPSILRGLQDAMSVFTAARYGRHLDEHADAPAGNGRTCALDTGIATLRTLHRAMADPVRRLGRLFRAANQ